MATNDTKDLSEYNTLTANDIAKITGGNYRTVKRVLEKMVEDKTLTSTIIKKNNREVEAYYTTNSTIKSIQATLKGIRNNIKQVAPPTITTVNTNTYKFNNDNIIAPNTNDDENVTIREVIDLQKRNNELENQIVKLQLEVKDLEMKNTVLDSDNKLKDKDILLITDKSKEFEKNYFEKVQEVQQLQMDIKHRNILLLVLFAVILVALTIAGTIYFIR